MRGHGSIATVNAELRPGLERLITYLNDTHEPMAAGFFFTGILVNLVNLTEAKVAVYAEAHQRWQTMLNNRQLIAPPSQP